jgi:hypothetical protein
MGEHIFGTLLHEMQDFLCILVQTLVTGLLLVGVSVT